MPFGASSFVLSLPPSMNLRFVTFPSGESALMKPLLSASSGLPWMFETR